MCSLVGMAMPGSILSITPDEVRGWASHPRHVSYSMLVHMIADGRVRASVLADQELADPRHAAGARGFVLPLASDIDPRRFSILLGETDEHLPNPAAASTRTYRLLTVEDLMGIPVRRPWADGTCAIDAAEAGLQPETIIDLLCRDYLGRPAGPVVLHAALAQLRSGGGYDDIRRTLLAAGEYRHRRVQADAAPGAIFAQPMILSVASRDFATDSADPASLRQVSALPLLQLDSDAFVTACYRQILRKEPDRAGLSHYLHELAAGVTKIDIIRHLAREFETISAGTQVIDLAD
jgi:hypothetical protein